MSKSLRQWIPETREKYDDDGWEKQEPKMLPTDPYSPPNIEDIFVQKGS
jgi:hypothetical protein